MFLADAVLDQVVDQGQYQPEVGHGLGEDGKGSDPVLLDVAAHPGAGVERDQQERGESHQSQKDEKGQVVEEVIGDEEEAASAKQKSKNRSAGGRGLGAGNRGHGARRFTCKNN